jgi:hypothetical protein
MAELAGIPEMASGTNDVHTIFSNSFSFENDLEFCTPSLVNRNARVEKLWFQSRDC